MGGRGRVVVGRIGVKIRTFPSRNVSDGADSRGAEPSSGCLILTPMVVGRPYRDLSIRRGIFIHFLIFVWIRSMETALYGNSGDASGWPRIAAPNCPQGMRVDGPD